MGSSFSNELGDDGLAERCREDLQRAVHRMTADDPELVEMHAPNMAIGDSGVEQGAPALLGTTHLVSLDLAYNGITAKGAKYLAAALAKSGCGSTTLQELRLSGNPIGAEGCMAIAQWLNDTKQDSALKGLYLFQCELTDEAVLHLANALQGNRSLTALNLDNNRLSNKSAVMLAQMLQTNKALSRLSFDSPVNLTGFKEEPMSRIAEALARNADAVAHREMIADIKAKKAARRREAEAAERERKEQELAAEQQRVEAELGALEALKQQEDEEMRRLEQQMEETVQKRNAKIAAAQAAREHALLKAQQGAQEWADKMTGHGTVQKEWRSGFTIMRTAPGKIGGMPTVATDAPRRLRACWCDPQDATAPFAKTLHYHCKWEEDQADLDGTDKKGYQGCKGSGHICATVGFYTKPRPDTSAAHFFASAHPGAAA